MTQRVHVYLDATEHRELERLADRLGSSRGFVMRIALRRLLGLDVPAFVDELVERGELEQRGEGDRLAAAR